MAKTAQETPQIPEVDAATDGLLGPISGFIYSNAPYTGTYVYPEFLDANGVIIWATDDDGSGVAVGTDFNLLPEGRHLD